MYKLLEEQVADAFQRDPPTKRKRSYFRLKLALFAVSLMISVVILVHVFRHTAPEVAVRTTECHLGPLHIHLSCLPSSAEYDVWRISESTSLSDQFAIVQQFYDTYALFEWEIHPRACDKLKDTVVRLFSAAEYSEDKRTLYLTLYDEAESSDVHSICPCRNVLPAINLLYFKSALLHSPLQQLKEESPYELFKKICVRSHSPKAECIEGRTLNRQHLKQYEKQAALIDDIEESSRNGSSSIETVRNLHDFIELAKAEKSHDYSLRSSLVHLRIEPTAEFLSALFAAAVTEPLMHQAARIIRKRNFYEAFFKTGKFDDEIFLRAAFKSLPYLPVSLEEYLVLCLKGEQNLHAALRIARENLHKKKPKVLALFPQLQRFMQKSEFRVSASMTAVETAEAAIAHFVELDAADRKDLFQSLLLFQTEMELSARNRYGARYLRALAGAVFQLTADDFANCGQALCDIFALLVPFCVKEISQLSVADYAAVFYVYWSSLQSLTFDRSRIEAWIEIVQRDSDILSVLSTVFVSIDKLNHREEFVELTLKQFKLKQASPLDQTGHEIVLKMVAKLRKLRYDPTVVGRERESIEELEILCDKMLQNK